MCRIDDTIHFKGGHTITRKTTGMSVSENDHDAEASIPSHLNACFVKFFVLPDRGCRRVDLKHGVERCFFFREKIRLRFDYYSPRPFTKSLISKTVEKACVK